MCTKCVHIFECEIIEMPEWCTRASPRSFWPNSTRKQAACKPIQEQKQHRNTKKTHTCNNNFCAVICATGLAFRVNLARKSDTCSRKTFSAHTHTHQHKQHHSTHTPHKHIQCARKSAAFAQHNIKAPPRTSTGTILLNL